MDNRKENDAKQQARVRKRTMPDTASDINPPPAAYEFLLPAKRREERQTDFISAISIRGDARHKYAHNTTNIIDKVKGRSS